MLARLPVKLLFAAISGLLLFLIFPNVIGLELPPLAFVALVPLLLALESAKRARPAALIGAFSGLAG